MALVLATRTTPVFLIPADPLTSPDLFGANVSSSTSRTTYLKLRTGKHRSSVSIPYSVKRRIRQERLERIMIRDTSRRSGGARQKALSHERMAAVELA
jgi:hypothetical protein